MLSCEQQTSLVAAAVQNVVFFLCLQFPVPGLIEDSKGRRVKAVALLPCQPSGKPLGGPPAEEGCSPVFFPCLQLCSAFKIMTLESHP